MKAIVYPGNISGSITAPVSKSEFQRYIAGALLCKGNSYFEYEDSCEDVEAALKVAVALGAAIFPVRDGYQFKSGGVKPFMSEASCGESGLCIRMFAPIAAVSYEEFTLKAEGTLEDRSVDILEAILPPLGVSVHTQNGKPPVTVRGPLKHGSIEIDGSHSSQYITGLLMALASLGKPSELHIMNPTSKPYLELTLRVIAEFGVSCSRNENYTRIIIPESKGFAPIEKKISGDWSAATAMMVCAAISGEVFINGLSTESFQADERILDILAQCGAEVKVNDEITVKKGILKPLELDLDDAPDLFPPMAALAAYCNGESRLTGVHRLVDKESNRAESIIEEYGKLGVQIRVEEDTMIIQGNAEIKGTSVRSRGDHRIAMGCAILALGSDSPVTIEEAEAVNKSYRCFFKHLESCGVTVVMEKD